MSSAKLDCDNTEVKQVEREKPDKKPISYNDIAAKLLEDRLLLTALELHTEFVEAGKELRVLRDFFSNPGNFETSTQEFTARLCTYLFIYNSHVLETDQQPEAMVFLLL